MPYKILNLERYLEFLNQIPLTRNMQMEIICNVSDTDTICAMYRIITIFSAIQINLSSWTRWWRGVFNIRWVVLWSNILEIKLVFQTFVDGSMISWTLIWDRDAYRGFCIARERSSLSHGAPNKGILTPILHQTPCWTTILVLKILRRT